MANYRAGYVGSTPPQDASKSIGAWNIYEQKERRSAGVWPKVNNGLTDKIVSITGVGNTIIEFESSANFDQYYSGIFVKAGAATTAKFGPRMTCTATANTQYTGTPAQTNTALHNGTFYMNFTNGGDYWDFAYSGVTAGQTLRIQPSNNTGVSLTGNVSPTGTITQSTKVTFTSTSGTYRVTLAGSVACAHESAVHYWSTSGEVYSVDATAKKITLKTEWTGSTRSWPVDGETIIPTTVSDFVAGDQFYKFEATNTYPATNYNVG